MFKQYLIKYKYNIEFHKSCCFTWSTKNIHRYLIKIEIQINVKLQLSENKQKINMIVCTAYTHFQNWSTKQTTGAQSPHLIDFFTITSKFSLHPNPTTTTATSSSPPNFSINQKITSPVGPHPLFLSHTLTHHTRTYIYMQETWKTCFSPMTQACSRQAVRLLSLSLFLGAPHPQFLSPHHKRRALLPSPPPPCPSPRRLGVRALALGHPHHRWRRAAAMLRSFRVERRWCACRSSNTVYSCVPLSPHYNAAAATVV